MNQTVESKRYYPTALALYITYFVLGIAAIGLGRLIAFPVAGPLSDRLGRRLSALIGCGLYAIFLLGIVFAPSLYVGYVLAVVSGMANSFLDTSITPSCMEIFKEKGTIANIFTKLSISIAQFLLPFAIRFVATHGLPFRTIFIATAAIIIADGVLLAFLPFPRFEKAVQVKGQKKEKMHFTPAANEMFPRNRGVITSIVMISSSLANYIVVSVAGVLTRAGGANGPRLVVLLTARPGVILARVKDDHSRPCWRDTRTSPISPG